MAMKGRKTCKIAISAFTASIILLGFFTYFYYVDLKKRLVANISDRISSFAGQKVVIEDLTLGLPAKISLHEIKIKNPDNFAQGQLFSLKRLSFDLKTADLFKGRFYFKQIDIHRPEISLIRDQNGRFNISDKLMQLFKQKSTTRYKVDDLRIESGIIDLNNPRLRIEHITSRLKDISSEQGAKTSVTGSASYAGNKILFKGWAAIKDEPKKFNISISSENFTPNSFQELVKRHNISIEKTKINISLAAEGDTEKGVSLKSNLRIKNIGIPILNKAIDAARLSSDAFFSMQNNSVVIKNVSLDADNFLSAGFKAAIKDIPKKPAYTVDLKISRLDLSALNLKKDLRVSGIMTSDRMIVSGRGANIPKVSGAARLKEASIKSGHLGINNISAGLTFSSITMDSAGSVHGSASVDAKNISVQKTAEKRKIIKNVAMNTDIKFEGKDLDFKLKANDGNIAANVTGTLKNFLTKKRNAKINIHLPDVTVSALRDSLWEIFPDKLLYAGLNGSLSSEITVDYSADMSAVNGTLNLKNLLVEGENGEYFVGPINGTLPVSYSTLNNRQNAVTMPSFERARFEEISRHYSDEAKTNGLSMITIDTVAYGFNFLENINLWIKQTGAFLNIDRFSADMFGGSLNGSAILNFSDKINYRAGIIMKGLSLTKLCEEITPIKDYITGKIDGIANIKGSGNGISKLIGKADFWTYSSGTEKTKISKEFLRKIGGETLKAYLGDRNFDKGIMSLYIQDGFIIFKDLEISNRNFIGITDLSIKVAPFNNRIAIDHLMWTITEAAQRAKGSQ